MTVFASQEHPLITVDVEPPHCNNSIFREKENLLHFHNRFIDSLRETAFPQ